MEIMDLIRQNRVIAIVRGMHPDQMAPLARALERGGIRMMEITFNQSAPETFQNTVNAIRALSQNMRDMAIGAGTVMTLEQLHMAADAGARYIISPDVNPALIAETKRLGLTALPGAMSPTEIVAAWNAGADAVKVFPIGDLGVNYLKAIRAPLSHIPLIAVGGVSERNCADFLRAGAIAVGVGGQLVNREWIDAGEFYKIASLAGKIAQAAQNAVK